ncbi:hypothetical protein NEF87_002312 [Candidatus Lokiarchaeum ossiferum]|uniref:SCP2 domain-containing protein n=1 Tax=Candidatus Lokiarchaeum ossiferum TaxID=2951803 RepID=A0ABY6HUK5_9ARCH|nr:hypothetical protein NEF87_002312 [Candidatus Lokiarchaeum sp. B-35]
MSEKTTPEINELKVKKKKKKLLGFPKIIWNQLSILNESSYFKEIYGEDHFNLLLIATDDRRAAIVRVKDGTVAIEQVKNKPEFIDPVKKQIKPRLTTDIETFFGFAMGKVHPVKAILTGKLKIRKVKTVLRFTKFLGVAAHETKNRNAVEKKEA